MVYLNWQQAVQETKIPRINYKAVLGMSLTKYVMVNSNLPDHVILKRVLLELKKPENKQYMNGINFYDASNNIRVSISARRSEHKTYSHL